MMIDEQEFTELNRALAALKQATFALEPPAEVESRLLYRLYGAQPRVAQPAIATATSPATSPVRPIAKASLAPRQASAARRPWFAEHWGAWLTWPVSLAATIMFCSWMLGNRAVLEPTLSAASPSSSSVESSAGTPFLALASIDEIAASGSTQVVSARLPRATLAEFGLPVSPMHAGDDVAAEFLVGESGGVLAVRFILADAR